MRKLLAISLLALVSLSANALTFPEKVRSDKFVAVALPAQWQPVGTWLPIESESEFPRQELRSAKASEFVALYGPPTEVRVPRSGKGDSFLLYKLKSGYLILVYVPSLENDYFSIAALFRPNGKPDGRIVK